MKKANLVTIFLVLSSLAHANSDDYHALEQRIDQLTYKLEQLEHNNSMLEKKIEGLLQNKHTQSNAAISEKQGLKGNSLHNNTKKPKEDFDTALNTLKEQNYPEAEKLFSNFVKNYPNSEYTGESYYWLAESYALRKKYDKAAVNYIMSFNKFPKNKKADLSMLKLVSALNILGKKKEACSTLAKLEAKNANLDPTMKKLLSKEKKNTSCK